MPERRILAGGGFRMLPEERPLFGHALELTGAESPRVCLLPTAGGERPEYILMFYEACRDAGVRASHLILFQRTVGDLRGFLLDQDLIVVSGGNTANALAVWRVHGVDAILREAWEAGIVLAGGSAGANCWFEASVTDSFGLPLAPLHDGLGFLPGSFCPHYDGEPERRPTYRRLVGEGFPAGYAADDEVGLHFRGRELEEVVSGRAGATAYRVEGGPPVREEPLAARVLPETAGPAIRES